MTKIGIFWVYRGTVLGRARELPDGEEGIPGIIDSPDSHVDIWPAVIAEASRFPALKNLAYEDVPRGRVLFDKDRQASIVYLDKILNARDTKAAIGRFFDLNKASSRWESDPHYTTDRNAIDLGFE